jgi:hypothetical protein
MAYEARLLASVKVRAYDPSLSLSESAFPLHEVIDAKLVTASLCRCVAVAAIQDHSLIETDWLKDALCSDVSLKFFKSIALDHGEHVGEGMGDEAKEVLSGFG